jgi:ABC-type multidrug transport system permease subunit
MTVGTLTREVKISKAVRNLFSDAIIGVLLFFAALGSVGWISVFLWILFAIYVISVLLTLVGVGMIVQKKSGVIK